VAVSCFEEMASALRALAKDPARYQAMAQNARQYFAQNHTVDAVMPRFEAVLRQAALGRAAKQATV
jgi:glycosyltransferase involved in cell wall biosynthesis